LNQSNAGESIALDAELSSVLSEVLAWSARTDRAFDPTVAALVQAWDLRGRGRVPSTGELAAALAATGAGHFRLDAARGTAVRLDPLAGIDEGAWGKGYALDRAAERLADAGVQSALIDLGGQVLARGRDASGLPWTIAIADPRDRARPVVALRLSNVSVSTSGDSERSRDIPGRRIGHLLDPRTGEPAEDFGSVTVVAASGLDADVLSTALFVLGPENGLALSDRLRREGLANEALFLVVQGEALEARTSPGLRGLVLGADPELVHGLAATSWKTP
jgi:thiamine biosynthesis lipoprotein